MTWSLHPPAFCKLHFYAQIFMSWTLVSRKTLFVLRGSAKE